MPQTHFPRQPKQKYFTWPLYVCILALCFYAVLSHVVDTATRLGADGMVAERTEYPAMVGNLQDADWAIAKNDIEVQYITDTGKHFLEGD